MHLFGVNIVQSNFVSDKVRVLWLLRMAQSQLH